MGTRNVLGDAVLFATTSTGTGTINVGSAVTGYFAPADVSPSLDGLRVGYCIVDSLTAPTIREVGEGVLTTGSPWTMTRATIRRSLTGGVAGSSALNLSAGTKYVFITPLAANLVQFDTDGYLHTAGDLVLATNGTARLTLESDGTFTFASAANFRAGLGVPALPTNTGSTPGTFTVFNPGDNTAATLPAGGTWAWVLITFVTTSGIWAASDAGVAAGGSTVRTASVGNRHEGFAWRIT